MKTKIFIIAAIVGMVLVGCKKKIEEPGVLTMTTTAEGEYRIYLTGTGTANIDWGDGSSDIVTLSNLPEDLNDIVYCYFKRTYASAEVKTITVTGNILSLAMQGTGKVTALDVSKMPALKVLWCMGEKLNSLDVSKNTALIDLRCVSNNLDLLDVRENTALTLLRCMNNNLTELDVSKNTALTELYCSNNKLSNLDVSTNTALISLYCMDNKLTTLDVSKNTALTYLDCLNNQLNVTALNALFTSLPDRTGNSRGIVRIHNNPGVGQPGYDKTIATNKNWLVNDF